MQLGQGSAITAVLQALLLRHFTYVRTGWCDTSHLGNVSMTLAADGAGGAIEGGGNAAHAVVLQQQAGHGPAVFGLALIVAPGCRLHLLSLLSLQVLHFSFEFALSEIPDFFT